jgi:hypothetical protein
VAGDTLISPGDETLPLVGARPCSSSGGRDHGVIELNQAAYDRLRCVKEIKIVPGATHLFEEHWGAGAGGEPAPWIGFRGTCHALGASSAG